MLPEMSAPCGDESIEDLLFGFTHSDSSALMALVKKRFKDKKVSGIPSSAHTPPFWGADYYLLEQSTFYQSLPETRKYHILESLSQTQILNMHYVEKLGFTYCSKLCLSAETIEEKLVYAQMLSDESEHYVLVSQFLKTAPGQAYKTFPMLTILAECMNEAPRGALIFLIQAFLETFGIRHYRRLSRGCASPELQVAMNRILVDEAFHAGSGKAILQSKPLSENDREYLVSHLLKLCRVLRAGEALLLVGTMKAVCPEMSALELQQFALEVNLEQSIQSLNHEVEIAIRNSDLILHQRLLEAGVFNEVCIQEVL